MNINPSDVPLLIEPTCFENFQKKCQANGTIFKDKIISLKNNTAEFFRSNGRRIATVIAVALFILSSVALSAAPRLSPGIGIISLGVGVGSALAGTVFLIIGKRLERHQY